MEIKSLIWLSFVKTKNSSMTKLFLKYDKIFISVLIDLSLILFFPKIIVGSLNLTLIFGLVKLLMLR